jgi:hypothetical protein
LLNLEMQKAESRMAERDEARRALAEAHHELEEVRACRCEGSKHPRPGTEGRRVRCRCGEVRVAEDGLSLPAFTGEPLASGPGPA